ncbi:MAG: MerR family DNA-binding transcriptional regulator [Candidatus Vogelbacteria bacterium]|nr:MerR family DNA-binding transcriptional regulator [Candidatus Vogelbacteria bacterium]
MLVLYNSSKILDMTKGFVTIKSASEIAGVSIETLRNWDKQGKLQSKRDPKNGYRLYSISHIQDFLKTNASNPRRIKRAKLAD